jgi:hypothetical protein
VLAAFRGAALGGLLTLVVVGGPHATTPSQQPGDRAEADVARPAGPRSVADRDCSHAGLGHRAVAGSALIRTARGEVRQVSFDVGWDVYNGRRPGTLIAVCLDDRGSGPVRAHG